MILAKITDTPHKYTKKRLTPKRDLASQILDSQEIQEINLAPYPNPSISEEKIIIPVKEYKIRRKIIVLLTYVFVFVLIVVFLPELEIENKTKPYSVIISILITYIASFFIFQPLIM